MVVLLPWLFYIPRFRLLVDKSAIEIAHQAGIRENEMGAVIGHTSKFNHKQSVRYFKNYIFANHTPSLHFQTIGIFLNITYHMI